MTSGETTLLLLFFISFVTKVWFDIFCILEKTCKRSQKTHSPSNNSTLGSGISILFGLVMENRPSCQPPGPTF